MVRAAWTVAVVVVGMGVIAAGRLSALAEEATEPPPVTLMGSLAEWMYPEATMPHGATMKDGHYGEVQAVNCHALLETKDDFETVLMFYDKLLELPQAEEGAEDSASNRSRQLAQSVAVVDDSDGRPVKLRVITVTRAQSSTTLVISQGPGEKVTRIAWLQHRDLAAGE